MKIGWVGGAKYKIVAETTEGDYVLARYQGQHRCTDGQIVQWYDTTALLLRSKEEVQDIQEEKE